MAVVNIRVEDRICDQLKEIAAGESVTVSEYVRNLVMPSLSSWLCFLHNQLDREGYAPEAERWRITCSQFQCRKCARTASKV